MAILNNPIKKVLTASSGSASDIFNTHGTCQQILVKPETANTTYDFTIINSHSIDIFSRTSEAGTLNELVTLPLSGIYTVQIENASVDEDFDVLVVVRNS